MPTVKDARDAATRIRRGYAEGWFFPDVRRDIGVILDYVEGCLPKQPLESEVYALEPGKHYVMAYDTAAVSSCMLKASSEGLAVAGIHVFMVGVRGNPKDAIAFAPANQVPPPTVEHPRENDENSFRVINTPLLAHLRNCLKKEGAVPGLNFPEIVSNHPFLDYARKYYKARKERKETK